MSAGWVGFACGFIMGGVAGVLVLALCMAAKRSDQYLDLCHCDYAEQGRACGECQRVQYMGKTSAEFDELYTLKMFCANGHEWHGEFIPAVCPRCYMPSVGARL